LSTKFRKYATECGECPVPACSDCPRVLYDRNPDRLTAGTDTIDTLVCVNKHRWLSGRLYAKPDEWVPVSRMCPQCGRLYLYIADKPATVAAAQ